MELRHSEHREQRVQRRGCPEGGGAGVWDRGPRYKGSRPAGDLDFLLRPGSTGTEKSRLLTLRLQMRPSVHCRDDTVHVRGLSPAPHRWVAALGPETQRGLYHLHRPPPPSPEARGGAGGSREREAREAKVGWESNQQPPASLTLQGPGSPVAPEVRRGVRGQGPGQLQSPPRGTSAGEGSAVTPLEDELSGASRLEGPGLPGDR